MSGIGTQITQQPCTTVIIGACVLIWAYLWNDRVDVPAVAYQFDAVVVHGQWWRIFTSTFTHMNLLHLAFNCVSLWSVGTLEAAIGPAVYLKWTLLIILLSMGLITLVTWLRIWRLQQNALRNTYSLGYSCVVFGLMSLAYASSAATSANFFGLNVPMWMAPLGMLLLTQIIIPNASFVGHASGVLLGYLIGWGLFDWFSDYLAVCAFIWSVLLTVYSLKRTTALPLGCITINAEQEEPAGRMENGVLVRQRPQRGEPLGGGRGRGRDRPQNAVGRARAPGGPAEAAEVDANANAIGGGDELSVVDLEAPSAPPSRGGDYGYARLSAADADAKADSADASKSSRPAAPRTTPRGESTSGSS